jgi:predicted acetyltransferase
MPTSELSVRPLSEPELSRFIEIDNVAFLEGPYGPKMTYWQRRFLEVDRTIGVFDGQEQVGGASIFTMRLTVPEGRQVPLAGVSWVNMLPTHRRRGGLTKMMRHQLDDLHERGAEPVASLTASHPAIYGRYGYGRAAFTTSLTIKREHNALRVPPGTDDVTLRLVDPSTAIEVCKEKYSRHVLRRPGMLEKPDWWYEYDFADLPEMRSGQSRLRLVLAERDGAAVGYASYRTKATGPGHEGEANIRGVYADDPAAYAALWRMLLNIDLVNAVDVTSVAADDPLLEMLESARYANPTVSDSLYVRFVDVDRALAARTYAAPIDVVFKVADEFCPWNAGRWRLVGDEKGATCERTESAADLGVDVRELGAIYLGGVTLRALADAGRVVEHTTGAVRAASKAFASDIQPWLSLGF